MTVYIAHTEENLDEAKTANVMAAFKAAVENTPGASVKLDLSSIGVMGIDFSDEAARAALANDFAGRIVMEPERTDYRALRP